MDSTAKRYSLQCEQAEAQISAAHEELQRLKSQAQQERDAAREAVARERAGAVQIRQEAEQFVVSSQQANEQFRQSLLAEAQHGVASAQQSTVRANAEAQGLREELARRDREIERLQYLAAKPLASAYSRGVVDNTPPPLSARPCLGPGCNAVLPASGAVSCTVCRAELHDIVCARWHQFEDHEMEPNMGTVGPHIGTDRDPMHRGPKSTPCPREGCRSTLPSKNMIHCNMCGLYFHDHKCRLAHRLQSHGVDAAGKVQFVKPKPDNRGAVPEEHHIATPPGEFEETPEEEADRLVQDYPEMYEHLGDNPGHMTAKDCADLEEEEKLWESQKNLRVFIEAGQVAAINDDAMSAGPSASQVDAMVAKLPPRPKAASDAGSRASRASGSNVSKRDLKDLARDIVGGVASAIASAISGSGGPKAPAVITAAPTALEPPKTKTQTGSSDDKQEQTPNGREGGDKQPSGSGGAGGGAQGSGGSGDKDKDDKDGDDKDKGKDNSSPKDKAEPEKKPKKKKEKKGDPDDAGDGGDDGHDGGDEHGDDSSEDDDQGAPPRVARETPPTWSQAQGRIPYGSDGPSGGMFQINPDGTLTTRKEADKLIFKKFGDVLAYRECWNEMRRTVRFGAGNRSDVREWFDRVSDVEKWSFESLNDPGASYAVFDSKLFMGVLDCSPKLLASAIRKKEDEMLHENKDMSGLQAARMLVNWFATDKSSRILYDTRHLELLPYPGDPKLQEYLHDWGKLLIDQVKRPDKDLLETIFFAKIKDSEALRPYLDHYKLMPDGHADKCYRYLIESAERYVLENRLNNFTDKLLESVKVGHREERKNKHSKKEKAAMAAMAAQEEAHAGQCPFHLRYGCRDPTNCDRGKHDQQFKGTLKGKGKGKGGGKTSVATPGPTKGDTKGKGKDKDKSKAGKNQTTSTDPKLDPNATLAPDGRRPCYPFQHGKCNDPNCKLWHGKETPAMQKKRVEDEKKIKARKEQGAASETGGSASETGQKPKPKAKAKAKPKAKGKAKARAADVSGAAAGGGG